MSAGFARARLGTVRVPTQPRNGPLRNHDAAFSERFHVQVQPGPVERRQVFQRRTGIGQLDPGHMQATADKVGPHRLDVNLGPRQRLPNEDHGLLQERVESKPQPETDRQHDEQPRHQE